MLLTPKALSYLSRIQGMALGGAYSVEKARDLVNDRPVWVVLDSGRVLCSCLGKDDALVILSALVAQDDTGDLDPID